MSRYWLPVAVAFVCQMMGIGILGAYSFFVEPLAREFDVGVALINTGPVLILIAPAFVAPIIGRFIDRHSIRNLMLWGVFIAGASLMALAQAPSLILVGVCFAGYAVGQVMYGAVVLNSLLVKLYLDGAGRALAIGAMGVSLGSVIWPFVTALFMDSHGWRVALGVLATCLLCTLGLTVRLGLPRHVSRPVAAANPGPASAGAYLKTSPFWLIGLAASVVYNVALAIGICYAPHFGQLGFTNTDVAVFIAAGGAGGLLGKIVVAAFADRFRAHIRRFALIPVILMLAGLVMLMSARTYFAAMMATTLVGAAGGAFIPLHPFINSAYYRAEIIGQVNSAQAPMMLPLGLLCAPMAGYIFDTTGSYESAFTGAIVLLLAGTGCFLALPEAPAMLADRQPA